MSFTFFFLSDFCTSFFFSMSYYICLSCLIIDPAHLYCSSCKKSIKSIGKCNKPYYTALTPMLVLYFFIVSNLVLLDKNFSISIFKIRSESQCLVNGRKIWYTKKFCSFRRSNFTPAPLVHNSEGICVCLLSKVKTD